MTTTTPMTMPEIERRIRKSIAPEQLRQWLTLKPMRAYRDISLDWLAIGLGFAIAAQFQTLWSYAIALLIIGNRQYALFILAHDAIHGALHPHRRLNDTLARWFVYGPMFMALEDARRNHLQHHRHMGTPDDPDRYLHTFEGKNSPLAFLLYCSGLATFGKTVLKVTPFGRLLTPTPKTGATPPQTLLKDYLKQRLPVLIWQPLLIWLFWLSPLPIWAYLLLWVFPIYALVFVPDEIRAFCDHGVLRHPASVGDSLRLVSFTPPRWEAVLIAPHHMHYHAEHHLWPAIPHYNLHLAHRGVRDRPEITVRPSYLGFLGRVVRSLPLTAKTAVVSAK
ncbi:fatty acid desaturase [Phormidium yuhuli AB48]|uniref:Fatty acid desaturase n=1 Tax=Phormidium yuhuli AB48 TaxID=2940671 RepID=A0ABY5ANN8_9CYAN|nr:fatty acid desaturase [Phormidium yuhuli]USR90430.1 fatty acid desaturase [Phormidium yuhuli AB48]